MIDGSCISGKVALRWKLPNLSDDKSTLVQVRACCRQPTSHYLSQLWPRSMSIYDVTRPHELKQRDVVLTWLHRFEIWYVSLLQRCEVLTFHISERLTNIQPISHRYKISPDVVYYYTSKRLEYRYQVDLHGHVSILSYGLTTMKNPSEP